MWYDCQWDNSPQDTKITQKWTTIGHRTASCYQHFGFGLNLMNISLPYLTWYCHMGEEKPPLILESID